MNTLTSLLILVVIGVKILSCIADNNNNEKASLAFIIDDTGSMSDDIEAVIEGSTAIFETIIRSRYTPIVEYVLATFNDPTTSLRIVTRNSDDYIKVLKSITVDGGGDCPEYCMSGIKLGLEHCRYGSFLYVFTDASAKDFKMYEEIKRLAHRKGAKIVFVLTGMCGSFDSPDYRVYEDLAHATGGEVFHLGKTDIGDILSYVKYTVEAPTTLIASKIYPPGDYGFRFKTDPLMKDPLIAVTGDKPKLKVTAPDGTLAPIEKLVEKPRIVVAKIPEAKPDMYSVHVGNLSSKIPEAKADMYSVHVGSLSSTTVTVLAHTYVQFIPAFSTFLPPSFKYTTTRPVPGVKSYVAAKLIEGDIELTKVTILNMDFDTISETPLSILNIPEKSYVTDYMIDLPTTMFRVAVEGYDPITKSTVTRIATVPLEAQYSDGSEPLMAPTVSLDEDSIKVKVGDSVKLYCHVSGLPKPSISWIEQSTGIPLPARTTVVELPYNYVSILDTGAINDDVVYTCSAKSELGSDSKDVYIEMLLNHYLKVLEKPQDTEVEYNREAKLYCVIDAYPPAEITWYKGDKALIELPGNNTNILVSVDKSILTIISMQPEDEDTYVCIAQNDVAKKWLPAKVTINNIDCIIDLDSVYVNQPLVLSSSKKHWPRFFTDHGKMIVPRGESLTLYCLRGFTDFSVRFVTASCEGGSMFKVNGFSRDYTTILCTEPVDHVVESTGEQCLPGYNTERLKIGFGSKSVLNAYEVCFDKELDIPIYTKHHMPRISTEVDIIVDWEDGDEFGIDFDELYDCRQQINTISTILGKWFHRDDGCCFRKQQLVNQRDVFPGIAQKAVFSYLNVVPVWSTCYNNIWHNVETAVRELATRSEILVFTGIYGELVISTIYGVDEKIIIEDKSGKGQQVPMFLWKVVQNPTTKSSVAIIQINVPDLKYHERESYIKCPDICSKISWLVDIDWYDESKGLIYCCSLRDFVNGFGFEGVFEPFNNILK